MLQMVEEIIENLHYISSLEKNRPGQFHDHFQYGCNDQGDNNASHKPGPTMFLYVTIQFIHNHAPPYVR